MRRLWTLAVLALVFCLPVAVPADGRAHERAFARPEAASSIAARPAILVPTPPGLRPQSISNANQATSNWSGYAAETNLNSPASGSVSDVTGTWVVPTVTGGVTDAYCVDWIGIDGEKSSSVEQIGTEEDWLGGSASYSAWFEMYPAALQTISMTVSPGDVMSAEVRWVGGSTFALSLADDTTGATFTTQQTLGTTPARSSAEWIHEDPATDNGRSITLLPLAHTTPAAFSACDATIDGASGPIADTQWQNTGIDMVQGGATLEHAGPLDAGGASFAVAPPGTAPRISASSPSLTFDYTVGGVTPAAESLTLTNTGGGTLNWGAVSDSPSWLSCTPSLGGSGNSTLVSVDVASLAAGTYTGHVVVTAIGADNTPLDVPVTLNVLPPPPDHTPPTTTLHTTPSPNKAGWNNTEVFASLVATDNPGGSGVSAIYYSLDGASQQSYTTTIAVALQGVHTLEYRAVDASGNVEPAKNATISIDETNPDLSLRATATYTGSAAISAVASDSLSGVSHADMKLDSGIWTTATQVSTSVLGTHTVYARAFDFAGNERDVNATFTVTASPPVPVTLSTTTKLAAHSSVKVKKALKLTGTVSPSAAPGKVSIVKTRLVGKKWKSAGSATVGVAAGKFTYSFKPKSKGSWRFVATYSGGTVGVTTYRSSKSATQTVKVK